MWDDLPDEYRLSFLVGEVVRNDSHAEHETKVLWNRLETAGLGDGSDREDTFGRLLPQVLEMATRPGVPNPFRKAAAQTLNLALRAHQYRADLVHDLLQHGRWTDGAVWSALNQFPPRPMAEIERCALDLQQVMYRVRGLYVVAPHWVGGPVVEYADPEDLRSWMRVAQGNIADVPGVIRGTGIYKAPVPKGGWREYDPDWIYRS